MKEIFKVMNQEHINDNVELYQQFLSEYGLDDSKTSWNIFVDHYANKFDSYMYDYYDNIVGDDNDSNE